MKFKVDLKIFLLALIFLLTNQIYIYLLIMVFALIHELGHLLAGIILKMKPEKIELIPVGVSIAFKLNISDFNVKIGKSNIFQLKKILVAIAGPLTNILIIIIVSKLKIGMIEKLNIIYSNLLILVFNLLPIYPLDGGRILDGILNICIGKQKTFKLINIISIITLVVISIFSIFILKYNKNISLIFVTIYLWIIVYREVNINNQKLRLYKIMKENY